MRQTYRKFGLRAFSERRIADDSLALELDFMRHLALRAQEALSSGDDDALRSFRSFSANVYKYERTTVRNGSREYQQRQTGSSGRQHRYRHQSANRNSQIQIFDCSAGNGYAVLS